MCKEFQLEERRNCGFTVTAGVSSRVKALSNNLVHCLWNLSSLTGDKKQNCKAFNLEPCAPRPMWCVQWTFQWLLWGPPRSQMTGVSLACWEFLSEIISARDIPADPRTCVWGGMRVGPGVWSEDDPGLNFSLHSSGSHDNGRARPSKLAATGSGSRCTR